jgi:hypothetical protein
VGKVEIDTDRERKKVWGDDYSATATTQ